VRERWRIKGRLALIMSLALLALTSLGASVVRGEHAENGNLLLTLTGTIAPRDLPRSRLAPAAVTIASKLGTTDAAPLPQLRGIELVLRGRNFISTAGLPICPRRRLRNATSTEALARCGTALVGRGRLQAEVLLPHRPPLPTVARVLAFNGRGRGGGVAVWMSAFSSRPPISFMLPFFAHRANRGAATTFLARVPRSLGSWPRLSGLQMTLSRRYRYRGALRSYLNASCPIPHRFTVGFFPLARATFSFSGHRRISETIVRSCRVRQ
jgi:hypothetical protein